LGSEKFCQRAVDLISDDFFVGHEDVLEDRLIELAPYFVTRSQVEGMWIFEQSKVGLEELGSLAEVVDLPAGAGGGRTRASPAQSEPPSSA
jgi:hypothetical protein